MCRKNKRPRGIKGYLSIRNFSLTSCQKSSYLHISSHIIEKIKINNGIKEQHYNPLIQQQSMYIDSVEEFAFSLYKFYGHVLAQEPLLRGS